jgi:hypothetical protein
MARGCEVDTCIEPNPILRAVSLAAWYGDDAPVMAVCALHFEQWALAIREQAVPQWVAMLPVNL